MQLLVVEEVAVVVAVAARHLRGVKGQQDRRPAEPPPPGARPLEDPRRIRRHRVQADQRREDADLVGGGVAAEVLRQRGPRGLEEVTALRRRERRGHQPDRLHDEDNSRVPHQDRPVAARRPRIGSAERERHNEPGTVDEVKTEAADEERQEQRDLRRVPEQRLLHPLTRHRPPRAPWRGRGEVVRRRRGTCAPCSRRAPSYPP